MSLVVIDADVLGRGRTGDETYLRNLLAALPAPAAAAGLTLAAVTRRPELVPAGVRPLELPARTQELRMAFGLGRLLRRVSADLVHTQYALPLRCPCPAVVTIHDLSFEEPTSDMRPFERTVFRVVVPRAARRARKVLTVSERTRADLLTRYRLAPDRVVVTPNAVDPAFFAPAPAPAAGSSEARRLYVLAVGAVQERKNQRAGLAAARAVGLDFVVVGPVKDERVRDELVRGGADLRGYVPTEELVDLFRGAACLVQTSRFEGFGLPPLEAMACGTPVVCVDEPALVEVVGDAAVVVSEPELADGIRRALAERDRLVSAGRRRVAQFSWQATAERTVAAYVEALAG